MKNNREGNTMTTARRSACRLTLTLLIGVTAASAVAEAQAAVFVARRVLGRVETMSQQSTQPGGPSYDSAAVMIEAPPQKVYETAVAALRKASDQGLRVTREDPAELLVQFTNGSQIAGIKVTVLGDKLAQLFVTSAHTAGQPNAAQLVQDAVLRVCREMAVSCSPAAR
jgi:hypothetical protein